MRKGFEGIRELADLEKPQVSPNAVGSLLGELSDLSQGVLVKKTNEGELYVFDETIDSDGKTYVRVAIKKIDNSGISTFEELTYSYIEPHQAWYYNSFEGLEKGLRAARIWEGENDPLLGYCLRYARKNNESNIASQSNTRNYNRDNKLNNGLSASETDNLPSVETLRNDPRYVYVGGKQGIGIYFDLSSVIVNVCSPPLYEISGTYYHIKQGEDSPCSTRVSHIRFDEKNKITWSMENGNWKSMDVHGDTMVARGNRSAANCLFHAAYGRDFYESADILTPPVEYIVKDRMPAEAPVEANLEVLSNFDLYDSPRSNKVITSVSTGDIVHRTSCIVYTTPAKYPIKILRQIRCYKKNNGGSAPAGPFLQPGKYVYLLTYTGEGTYLGWYEGEEAWWLKGWEIAHLSDANPQQPWGEYIGNSAPRNLSIEVWYYVKKNDGNAGWVMVAQNGEYFPNKLKVKYNVKPPTPAQRDPSSNIKTPNQSQASSSSIGAMLRKHPLAFAAVFLLILGFFFGGNNTNKSTPKNTPKTITSTNNKANIPIEPIAKKNVITGYDSSKPILNDDGLCELTIDNTSNDMPVYVRVWDMNSYQPVRAFYIAQGEEFTAYDLTPSTYEVRYIELYDNDFPANGSKSELFELEQIESAYGIQYSQMSLTLYKVRNGNTQTTSIPASQI